GIRRQSRIFLASDVQRQTSSLRRQKRINNGTRYLPHAVLAVVDELAEHRLHAAEVGEFGLDLVEALAGDGAHRVALGVVRQLQQLGNLVQTESQFLGALDEVDAGHGGGGVVAEGAPLGRYRQQLAPLVVADGLD